MKEIDLWKFIEENLKKNSSVVLMVVAESSKSSPGRAGFKMAITSGGKSAGTIGGGIMEHNLLDECIDYLNNGIKVNLLKKLYHNKTAPSGKSGLICGGTETIILKSLDADNLPLISGLINNYSAFHKGVLNITHSGISFDSSNYIDGRISFRYSSEKDWGYEENCGAPDIIYIIGGGHVGLAVSKIMSTQDFYVVTVDPRRDAATMKANTYADKKLFIPFTEAGNHIVEGNNSYAVIVTSEHDTDLAALRSIINKNLRYIGLMGSRIKIKSIFDKMITGGASLELLNKVHAPIGIEISAESPEEIAVSIAAEIISVKNAKAPGGKNE